VSPALADGFSTTGPPREVPGDSIFDFLQNLCTVFYMVALWYYYYCCPCLPCDLTTTQLLAPCRGQRGFSLLKKIKGIPSHCRRPGYGSGCARHLVSCLSVQDLGCRSAQGKLLFPPEPSAQTGGIATAAHGGGGGKGPLSLPRLPPSAIAFWQYSDGELLQEH